MTTQCNNCNKTLSSLNKDRGKDNELVYVTKDQKEGDTLTVAVCKGCLPAMITRNWRIQNGT